MQSQIVRHRNRLSMQLVIVAPVRKLLADPRANLEAQLRRDRDVARIEQAMDVPPHQHPVGRLMRATIGKGADVSRIQCRKSLLA